MKGIHLFTIKGIPVGLNPIFLILVFILSMGMGDVFQMIIFGVCVFISILIHELGHALVAQRYGLRPAIMFHGFGGITVHSPALNSKQEFKITFAGPAAGLVVGGLFFLIQILFSVLGFDFIWGQFPYLNAFVLNMMWINLVWSIFNLLPCRPMDGGKLMGHILRKFMSEPKAEFTGSVISVILAGLMLVYFVVHHQMWMVFIAAYFLMMNLGGIREAYRSLSGHSGPKRLVGIQAEALYEKGRTAAREHDWKSLEIYGHQMKKVAEDADQTERAYELLTIACTNLGKYEEALNHSAHARESDAVRQAIERCKAMLD
jgi:Zn-dependent protease